MRTLLIKFMTSERLLARCARGGAVLGAGAAVERGMRLVRNMILARILAPDQFGLMALVVAAGGLFEVFTEVGVREAIVQNKRGDSKEFLNVAWWFSAARGAILYLLGLALVPLAAWFYREPLLESLLKVSFLTMLFSGLASTRLYALQKNLQFGRYVGVVQGAGLGGTIVSLVTAWFVPSVWALVAGFVAEAAFRCATSFILCPIRPVLRFDRGCAAELFGFARGMFGLPILTFLAMQADVFVLGRVCSKSELGAYSLAASLAMIPSMLFSMTIQPLILPTLSSFDGDRARLGETILRLTRWLTMFGLPAAACGAVFGGPILAVVYGQAYISADRPFALLLFYVVANSVGTLIASTYFSLARPDLHRIFTILRVVLLGILLYPAIRLLGTTGAAGGVLACFAVALSVQTTRLSGLLSLPLKSYVSSWYEGIIGAAAFGLVAFLLRRLLPQVPWLQVSVCGGLILVSCLAVIARLGGLGRLGLGSVGRRVGEGASV